MRTGLLVAALAIGVLSNAFADPPKVRKIYRHKTVTYEGKKVRDVIAGRSNEIRACYASVSGKSSNVYGTVVLEWEIAAKGNVDNISVVESLLSELDSCIADRIKTWTFPPPPGKTVAKVRFPFMFSEVYDVPKPAAKRKVAGRKQPVAKAKSFKRTADFE